MQAARLAITEPADPKTEEETAVEAELASMGANRADRTENRAAQVVPMARQLVAAEAPAVQGATMLTFHRQAGLARKAAQGRRISAILRVALAPAMAVGPVKAQAKTGTGAAAAVDATEAAAVTAACAEKSQREATERPVLPMQMAVSTPPDRLAQPPVVMMPAVTSEVALGSSTMVLARVGPVREARPMGDRQLVE
jgi:hypothetical protein